jgi:hypothetical protein
VINGLSISDGVEKHLKVYSMELPDNKSSILIEIRIADVDVNALLRD